MVVDTSERVEGDCKKLVRGLDLGLVLGVLELDCLILGLASDLEVWLVGILLLYWGGDHEIQHQVVGVSLWMSHLDVEAELGSRNNRLASCIETKRSDDLVEEIVSNIVVSMGCLVRSCANLNVRWREWEVAAAEKLEVLRCWKKRKIQNATN